MTEPLLSATILGLAAGLAPGPTTALIASQTLQYGPREGLKVAIAPLLTDGPIIIGSLLLLRYLVRFEGALAFLTLVGALFLFYLGQGILFGAAPELAEPDARPRSIVKGFLANLLNPHPYIFWISVGAPMLLRSSERGRGAVVLFLLALYGPMIGAKGALALLVAAGRSVLNSRAYRVTLRLLGAALILFALLYVREGLQLLQPLL